MTEPLQKFLDQAVQAFRFGKFEAAEPILRKALQLDPHNLHALHLLGLVKGSQSQHPEAASLLHRAIQIDPRNPSLQYNLAKALSECGAHAQAIPHHERAVALAPNNQSAWLNYGKSLFQVGRLEESLSIYDAALSVNASYGQAFLNKGVTLGALQRYEEALALYERAIRLTPESPEAWCYRGVAFSQLKRFSEGLSCFDKANSLKPDYVEASYNKSLSQLVTGDFTGGWLNYEFRWGMNSAEYPYRHGHIPRLHNLSAAVGRRLLVWSEQGYGDTLQFSRLVLELIARGADVVFEVQGPLKSLIRHSMPGCSVVSPGEPSQQADLQIPLLTLPLVFGINSSNIPAKVPYIKASRAVRERWIRNLSLSANTLNIGVACSGSENHKNDRNRSIDVRLFEPIAKLASLFLIQKNIRDSDREFLVGRTDIRALDTEIMTFEDSAAIVEMMDIIISVDTSLVHLSGALGKPTFVLLPWVPDWRWLLDRQDSPWYPTAGIFRQSSPGEWESVIARVVQELKFGDWTGWSRQRSVGSTQ